MIRRFGLAIASTALWTLSRPCFAEVLAPAAKQGGLRASFPLWSDSHPLEVELHGSLIAQYTLSLSGAGSDVNWFHAFELPRAQIRADVQLEQARGRVALEAVRSASEGSLIGVAGDSFVFRVREAWGAYTLFHHIDLQLGVVPTMTGEPLETMSGLRVINPPIQERTGLLVPADLGGVLRGLLPGEFGFVGVGLYNGEGYTQRELNRGKNLEVGGYVHPLAAIAEATPLAVQLSYVSGSSGTGLSRADRLTTAVAWEGDVVRGGASFTYAWGARGNGDIESVATEGFVRLHPVDFLALGATTNFWQRDVRQSGDWVTSVTGTVGAYPASVVGVFAAIDGFVLGKAARAALPEQDNVRFRLIFAIDF